MPHIFISYRRDDSKAITGRIYDRLVKTFGKDNVFKDVDRIPPGSTFAEVLDAELLKCNILLVIIGRTWVNITDAQGNRRLYKEDDFVRIEVERGLNRPDLLIIPVMVDGASVPLTSELPDKLSELSSLQVVQVRDDPDFHRDMNRLIDFLKEHDRQKLSIRERVRHNIFLILAVFITLLVIAIISFISNSMTTPPSTLTPTFDPFSAAQHLLTLTKQAEVAALATATPNYTATIEAILGGFITQTHEAETATANIYTYTPTPTVTINATATVYAVETVVAQSTKDKLAIINENATNDALATANAPTNTLQPTQTLFPTSTTTLSNTPTDTPVAIIPPTSTSIPTDATTEAQALLNAQATLDAQITATLSIKVKATINSMSANLRTGPGTSYSIIRSAQKDEFFPVIAQNGKNNDLWYLIDSGGGKQAWVSAKVITLDSQSSSIQIALTIPSPPVILEVTNTVACGGPFAVGATAMTTGSGMNNDLNGRLPLGKTKDTYPGGDTTETISASPDFAGWVDGYSYVTLLECAGTPPFNWVYKVRTSQGVVGWLSVYQLVKQS